ncbi:excinuclease ABC subunit UvrA [bacterium]|jgi:excinuclease ABC subunit A|nr:excinuclease ABC subunit UvrA [bacterium]MBT6293217.1 excinuclease ABC subunit UvrA [bacterium]
MSNKFLHVKGARMHNLKNIEVKIPKNKLTVITGLSGSGKSSLAFDTIYAEGQRRYVESMSAYARQFLQLSEKPDVDQIDGLSPAISIDQKTASRNPRSTVGTVTEIYDYLRLMFAKVGVPHDPKTGKPLERQSVSQMVEKVTELTQGTKIILLAPVVKGRKGQHEKVLDEIKKEGFVRVRLNGQIHSILEIPEIDPKKHNTLEIVVDRLVVKNYESSFEENNFGETVEVPNPNKTRLADSMQTAAKFGEGDVIILNHDTQEELRLSENFEAVEGLNSLSNLEPRMFSFNSPHGACQDCHGLGYKQVIDVNLLVPNQTLSLSQGAILPWANSYSATGWYYALLEAVCVANEIPMNIAFKRLSPEQKTLLFYGTEDIEYDLRVPSTSKMRGSVYRTKYEGVIPNLMRRHAEADSETSKKRFEEYMNEQVCPSCEGKRLRKEILCVLIGGKNIIDVTNFSVEKALDFFTNVKLDKTQAVIAKMILKEISDRLKFLMDVGLSYLTLSRSANTLSGGEAQRIRLATQIGSKLSGVLYVLDEPSIGLHQNDNDKLIKTLVELRDLGNTVIVVEHDSDTMLAADYIIDIGPGAGKHGGEVIFEGTPKELLESDNTDTGAYLSGKKDMPVPTKRRKGNGKFLEVLGASQNNLKNINVKFPLGKFIAVTGVSGSGKSTLVNDILLKEVMLETNSRSRAVSGEHKEIKGLENVDKVINIDQSPIGRTPRSNPATYTGVFTDIRNLLAATPEAKVRGYNAGRFSFNVKGGRCEDCSGDGTKKIEMHFLPDIYVQCETCNGKRYNRETLEVAYRGKNISDILAMTVEEAMSFFAAVPSIKRKMETLNAVGLGYIHLGQSANTLSGGEAQRVKLATELSKRSTGKTLYVLDEPTTGLHFGDVAKLLEVLQKLVDKGNTVLTIEHNLDVVKCVDHIIDIGQEGGDKGGEILVEGTPEEVAKHPSSYTAHWLKKLI